MNRGRGAVMQIRCVFFVLILAFNTNAVYCYANDMTGNPAES